MSPLMVKPGTKVKLKDYDPDDCGDATKEQAEERIVVLKQQLDVLQEELYAAGQHSVLIVLQGRDTSGKDGTIRKVFGDVNPAGCRVEAFKVPTEEELAHDFLWRVHRVTPRRGTITIFNRSHYEDVLVARVHDLVPKAVWEQRFAQINAFEQMLIASNTIVLKFYLHISKDEQEKRLLEREREAEKAWKLSVGDWKEREHWDDYTKAYEDALGRCSTAEARWQIVPANRKWFRNLTIAEAVVGELERHHKDWQAALAQLAKQRLAELQAFRTPPPSA